MSDNSTLLQIISFSLSYFSILPLLKLVEQFGLEIFDIRKQSVHGGTLRIFVSKKNNYSINDSVKIFIDDEYSLGLDKIEFYHKFSTNIIKLKKNSTFNLLEYFILLTYIFEFNI